MSSRSKSLSALGRRTEDPPISWLMKVALERPSLISLAAGFTDNSTLPVAETKELLSDILANSKRGEAALQYGTGAGDSALRDLTIGRLRDLDSAPKRAKAYAADRLMITHGSQQFLYIVTEALCDEGDIVLVEDPTYFVYLGISQSRGMQCRGIKMESDGIDLAHLEMTLERLKASGDLKRLKALYLVSYFQNPTGRTTSLEKKAAALKLLRLYERAAGHPIYLIEDAAYRELRFSGQPTPSAISLPGAEERVIYTGTYSKAFATGIRVGFGLLPQELFPVVMRLKGNHDFGTSNLLQQILVSALKSGLYQTHLETLRSRYFAKASVMHRALQRHCSGVTQWEEPEGGLYIWGRLPRSISTGMKSRLFKSALEHDLLYVPGRLCYADDSWRKAPNHEMRLSFGSASEANIRKGVKKLGEAIAECGQ